LAARGYHEVITYSFVEPRLQQQLRPDAVSVTLDNPMAETLSVMRSTLWSGLIPAWRYNHQRQQPRVRIFETGVCFHEAGGKIVERLMLGGLVAGAAAPEQWGVPSRPADFFDLKADLEALLGADAAEYRFQSGAHPALHPGQTAQILRGVEPVGWAGTVHPRLLKALDLPAAPLLFEFDGELLRRAGMPRPAAPSEFPSSRRDLAVLVGEEVPAAMLLEHVQKAARPHLRRSGVFDVYRGAGLPNGFKSVALSLIFQDNSRTLTDQEVDAAVQAAADSLIRVFGASIRGD
jgi:phenylalanyl-tRNA synthetase beta chain